MQEGTTIGAEHPILSTFAASVGWAGGDGSNGDRSNPTPVVSRRAVAKLIRGAKPPVPSQPGSKGLGNWPVRNATMEEVAGVMQSHLDRLRVDQTGPRERLDFQLQWT